MQIIYGKLMLFKFKMPTLCHLIKCTPWPPWVTDIPLKLSSSNFVLIIYAL